VSAQQASHSTLRLSRERLLPVLALPYVLLASASLIAWPWRAWGLPGVLGTLTPIGLMLLVGAVGLTIFALGRRLPLGMLTWVPAGQGALVLLTTGFVAGTPDAAVGIALIVAYVLIFAMVLAFAMLVAARGAHLAIVLVAFFIMTQAARFPVFEQASAHVVAGASWLTLIAAIRMLLELGLLAFLARRLVEAPPEHTTRVVVSIVGLTFAHGVFASWEDPLLSGELSLVQVVEHAVRWFALVGLQFGFVVALVRLRRSLSQEPRWAEPPSPSQEAHVVLQEQDPAPARRSGRPTRRRRRR
jgi:hypothetical protein